MSSKHVDKIRIKYVLILVGALALLSFYPFEGGTVKNKFRYEGTYSLYIENKEGLTFNWITETSDSSYYELTTSDNKLIVNGKTAKGKVHQFKSEKALNEVVYFKFGTVSELLHKVELRPNQKNIESSYSDVDSLFVVGDVHGRYDELIILLQKSSIIDDELNWIGGNSHLVFLGDLFDRGNDVTKVLWFIYQLEKQAESRAGKVHLVLGNHEIMTMSKDIRYVGPKENALASTYGKKYDELFHPSNSFLGNWLATKPAVIKIDKVIFAHGGIIDLGTNSIEEFNGWVNTYMQEPVFLDIMADTPDTTRYSRELWNQRYAFFYNPLSPFWYRGYVQSDTLQVQLNSMLRKYKSKIHVVAHTPQATVTQRYKGKLLTTDLNQAATELLFLKKEGKKYLRFKIDSEGSINKLRN